MGLKHYEINLMGQEGVIIQTSGGKCYVATNGGAAKATLYNKDGTSLSNPIALNYGKIEFYTADTVQKVDLYGQAPSGHGFIRKDVSPSGSNEFVVDTSVLKTTLVIPFSIADTTAATETDTGFDLPTNAIVQPFGGGVDVKTLDATEDINVGLLSTESGGDADGLFVGLSVATAVAVKPDFSASSGVLNGNTFGVLLSDYTAGTDAADRGLAFHQQHRCDGTAKSISYTLSTGTDTAAGFIRLPYEISAL